MRLLSRKLAAKRSMGRGWNTRGGGSHCAARDRISTFHFPRIRVC